MNRILKGLLFKTMYNNNNKRWVNILPQIVSVYNNTPHTGFDLKKTPNEMWNASLEERKEQQLKNVEKIRKSQKYSNDTELNIGDKVRLINKKKTNKDEPNYTTEVYEIIRIIKPKDNTLTRRRYKVALNGTVMRNTYNITELIEVPDDTVEPPSPERQSRRPREPQPARITPQQRNQLRDLNEFTEPVTSRLRQRR
jgi:hypothetical protein